MFVLFILFSSYFWLSLTSLSTSAVDCIEIPYLKIMIGLGLYYLLSGVQNSGVNLLEQHLHNETNTLCPGKKVNHR